MPFEKEHSARIVDPDEFEEFRRVNDELGKGVDVIFGLRESDGSEIQAIRFDKDKFTPEEARAWLKDHKFTPILFEEAKSKRLSEAGHDNDDKKSGGPGKHSHPHKAGAGQHDHEGLPSNTGGHSHGDAKVDGAHRHRPGDPPEGAHAGEVGADGEHRHPKALTRKAESVQWMPDFDGNSPDYVVSGEGARGLFEKIFRIAESATADNGVPYYVDEYAVRWVPEGQIDPATNEENVGASCWRGGL